MAKRKIASGVLATLIFACAIAFILAVLSIKDFDLDGRKTEEISFQFQGTTLSGTLVEANLTGPVILMVHGDGASDRFVGDGVLPLVNTLVEAGISVFSWDKPGVGASTGNWLYQSMEQRAGEVAAALNMLRTIPGYQERELGLLGFSQAGWVLPQVGKFSDDVSFMVLVGGAINWLDQGAYFVKNRREAMGMSPQEAARLSAPNRAREDATFGPTKTYKTYLASLSEKEIANKDEVISRDRFLFIQLNYLVDARDYIDLIDVPILTLSGEDDINADSGETISTYAAMLTNRNPLNEFRIIPNATHSLTRSEYYNYQRPGDLPYWERLRFLFSGRDAFAPNALATISNWINLVTK